MPKKYYVFLNSLLNVLKRNKYIKEFKKIMGE